MYTGLEISDKSKYFIINQENSDQKFSFYLCGTAIDKTDTYKCLGFEMNNMLDLFNLNQDYKLHNNFNHEFLVNSLHLKE